MRSWLGLKKMSFLVPAITIRATKPDAIALDDLFLAFLAPATLLLDYGGARRSVKKAIVILYHVVQLSP